MKCSRCLVLTAMICVLTASSLRLEPADAARLDPRIEVSPSDGAPGDVVQVRLLDWPTGSATVSTCGNGAARGSQDCDLVGSEGVGVTAGETTTLSFTITAPPAPCPCVLRATTPTGDFVRTVSFALPGLAVAPVVKPPSLRADDDTRIGLRAHVVTQHRSFPESWAAPFSVSANKALELTITNRGTTTMTGLRVVASVGRSRAGASPVAAPPIAPLASGAHRRIVVPLDIGVPAWGTYVVAGSVYGDGVAVPFRTTTSSDPWALELLLPLLLLVAARVVRRRERKREAAPLQESSPPIEDSYRERSAADGWIPLSAESPAGTATAGTQTREAEVSAAHG